MLRPAQSLQLPPKYRAGDMKFSRTGYPVLCRSHSAWVSASGVNPPLSTRQMSRPLPSNSLAIVMPAAPPPTMQTSASRRAGETKSRASIKLT